MTSLVGADNNRPRVALVIVDPLVGLPREAYIYGSAESVWLSDPQAAS